MDYDQSQQAKSVRQDRLVPTPLAKTSLSGLNATALIVERCPLCTTISGFWANLESADKNKTRHEFNKSLTCTFIGFILQANHAILSTGLAARWPGIATVTAAGWG